MSRSRKKCIWTISKAWDRFKERSFRKQCKQKLYEVEKEIKVDPDADFEESLNYKKMGDWGTKICFEFNDVKEDSDTWPEEEQQKYKEKGRRK